jgi:hypothetical protein
MPGKENHQRQVCSKCGSKRPRYTSGKKMTAKQTGMRAQQREHYCNRCRRYILAQEKKKVKNQNARDIATRLGIPQHKDGQEQIDVMTGKRMGEKT